MPLFAQLFWHDFPYKPYEKFGYSVGAVARRHAVIASIMDNRNYSPQSKVLKIMEVSEKWAAMDRVFFALEGQEANYDDMSDEEKIERDRLEGDWEKGIYAEFFLHTGEVEVEHASSSST